MNTETPSGSRHRRNLVSGAFLVSALLLAGATAVTWVWNTIVPDLAGLAPFRFAEGLSVAVGTLFIGALFETGRALAGQVASRHRDSSR